jgi:hypothetical protein
LFEHRPLSTPGELLSLLLPFLLQILQATLLYETALRWQAMDKHCCDNVIRDQGSSPPLFEISNRGLFREYDVREVSVERASAFPGCSQGPLSRPRRRRDAQDCRPCGPAPGRR